jgi:hypothetical protein
MYLDVKIRTYDIQKNAGEGSGNKMRQKSENELNDETKGYYDNLEQSRRGRWRLLQLIGQAKSELSTVAYVLFFEPLNTVFTFITKT